MLNIKVTTRVVMLAVTSAFVFVTSSTVVAADADWKKDHPRRAEVNQRLDNQGKRINQERKEGEITQARAHQLHKEDRQIRNEERAMASQNGGHITKQQQKTLNQQENAVSRQIGK
jgi:hypothetical protein